MAFVLLDLVADVLVEEQLAEDERAHGLHVQTLGLGQDLLLSAVDGAALLLLLRRGRGKETVFNGFSSLCIDRTLIYSIESASIIPCCCYRLFY